MSTSFAPSCGSCRVVRFRVCGARELAPQWGMVRMATRRGAALYLTAVALSIIIAGMGITLIASQRTDRRLQDNMVAEMQAVWAARAGLDIACVYMEQIPDWRQRVSDGILFSDLPLGNDAMCTVEIVDPTDGNLTDNAAEPVSVTSTGQWNGWTHWIRGKFAARPHPALSCAAFGTTGDPMEFRGVCIIKGRVRSHGNMTAASSVHPQSGASFETMSGYSIQDPLAPKTFANTPIAAPQVNINTYLAMASPVFGVMGVDCQLKGCNLTPTYNPTGPLNAQGIYALDAGGRSVLIENIHVQGTLIVYNTGGNPVSFQEAAWIEPGPAGYPVLLIDTNNLHYAELSLDLALLRENVKLALGGSGGGLGPGMDFNGDGDKLDQFPTSVRGIIWANSTYLSLKSGSWPFVGSAINRHIIVDNGVSIDDDQSLQNKLLPGFIANGMCPVSGSFKEAIW